MSKKNKEPKPLIKVSEKVELGVLLRRSTN